MKQYFDETCLIIAIFTLTSFHYLAPIIQVIHDHLKGIL